MSKTTYPGIDYATEIRYGVISQNSVMPEAMESAFNFLDGWADNIEHDGPYHYDHDGLTVQTEQDGCDLWIFKSPYFTRAQFRSSRAPGACYLLDSCEFGERAFCLGHDWFENGIAPYPVFSVATGEAVLPESQSTVQSTVQSSG